MTKQKLKEEKAQELFKLHYDELCDPDKKHVRNALKNKTLPIKENEIEKRFNKIEARLDKLILKKLFGWEYEIYLLLSKTKEKMSIRFIWETIAGEKEVSYPTIRNSINSLYQKGFIRRKWEAGDNHKYFWI